MHSAVSQTSPKTISFYNNDQTTSPDKALVPVSAGLHSTAPYNQCPTSLSKEYVNKHSMGPTLPACRDVSVGPHK